MVDKINEMDVDILVDGSIRSEGILGTIYYSEIIEIEREISTDTTSLTSVNDIVGDSSMTTAGSVKDFQLHNSITDINGNAFTSKRTGTYFQLGESSKNINELNNKERSSMDAVVNEVSLRGTDQDFQLGENSINVNELTSKDTDNVALLLGSSNDANVKEVTTKVVDKDLQLGENLIDGNTSVNHNISENNENTSLAITPEEYRLPMLKFCSFLKLKQRDKLEIIALCINLGLLGSKFACPKCKNTMELLKSPKSSDCYIWYCNGYAKKIHKGQKVKRSVRTGSIFFKSKLTFLDTLQLIHCWVYKVPREWIFLEMGISDLTVTEWFDFCRDVCVEICARDDSKIGGKGKIVEIEGGEYVRRKKDPNIKNISFVFIGTEDMYGGKAFLKIVGKSDRNTFLELVKSFVLPGSTIISEFCSVFKCHKDRGIVNLAKSCNYKFKDPKSCDLSKRKSFWNVVRKRLPFHKKEKGFDNYLAEHLWRKRNSSALDKMRKFLSAVKTIYPPPTIDE